MDLLQLLCFFFSFSVFKTRAKLETDFNLTSARQHLTVLGSLLIIR